MAKKHQLDFQIVDYDKRVEKIAEDLGDLFNEAPKVLKNAIAAAGRSVRKETVKQANKIYDYHKYGKPLAATNKTLRVKVGTKGDSWYSSLIASGPMSELADFMVLPNTTRGQRPPAYSARVKRSSPMEVFDKDRKPFLAYVKAGKGEKRHKVFVYRTGEDRLPLKKILAPSIPSMLENAGLKEIAENRLQAEIDKQIQVHIRKALQKAGRGKE